MAAPTIPNLALRSRGRRGGLSSLRGPTGRRSAEENDRIIRQTDQDASVSRLSAVEAGYLHDPFAKLFVAPAQKQRRLPIINRGTYVRTQMIDDLVDKFLAGHSDRPKQIVSLGAGSDTRFFRLMSHHGFTEESRLLYHEIDFAENLTLKLNELSPYGQMTQHLDGLSVADRKFHPGSPPDAASVAHVVRSGYYHSHAIDLRTLQPSTEKPSSLRSVDPSLPTVIISECCLCYLQPTAADRAALYFTKELLNPTTACGMIIYEPIKPEDAFGQVMVENLAARGIVLQTLKKYGSLDAQRHRMQAYGLHEPEGYDVNHLWRKGVSQTEKERIASLEMVDEVEEWELLASHYCVVWGWRDGGTSPETPPSCWNVWKDLY